MQDGRYSLDAAVDTEAARQELETLERILAQSGEATPAQMIRAVLGGSARDLRGFPVDAFSEWQRERIEHAAAPVVFSRG